MIPFVAVVSLRNQESRTFRIWIPLFLIWLLLLPLGVLLSPFIFIACLVCRGLDCRVNPFDGVAVMWQIWWALNDTELEVEHRSAGMSFHIL
jgi:uncharacterized membrane protein